MRESAFKTKLKPSVKLKRIVIPDFFVHTYIYMIYSKRMGFEQLHSCEEFILGSKHAFSAYL